MTYQPLKYKLNDLLNKQNFNHTQYMIETNHLIFQLGNSNNEMFKQLLQNIAFRLENTEKRFVIHLVGGDNKITKPFKSKSGFSIDSLNEKFNDELSYFLTENFNSLVFVHESFSDLVDSLVSSERKEVNGIKLLTSNQKTEYYIENNFKEKMKTLFKNETKFENLNSLQYVLDCMLEDEKQDTMYFGTNIYLFSTSYNKDEVVKVMDRIKEQIEDDTYYKNEIRNTKLHNIVTIRNKETIKVSNHIFEYGYYKRTDTKSSFQNFFNIDEMKEKQDTSRHTHSFSYMLNSLESQLVFNEFNNVITTNKTENTCTVLDLNTFNTYKEYLI